MALSMTFSPNARQQPLLNELDKYPKISKQASFYRVKKGIELMGIYKFEKGLYRFLWVWKPLIGLDRFL